jgi:hypothetical protein
MVIDSPVVLAMRERAMAFWQCVQSLEAPAPQSNDDVLSLWPHAAARIAQATPEVAAHVQTLRDIKRIAKGEDAVGFMVRSFMQDADTLTIDGEVAATFKDRKTTSLDVEKLKAEFPDAYKACKREGTTRALLLKGD